MNFSWKLYRKKFTEGLADAGTNESLFVLGVDLGNRASSIAFFDLYRMSPETIDVSGGYGKPSMPTALQYVRESKEWVYGEYALLNHGLTPDTLYTSLMDKLSKKEYLDVDGKPQSSETVLGIFLKELLSNCKSINPKAEIAGITLSVPSYAADEIKNSVQQVFKLAGYEKSLIGLDADRDCVFTYYFHSHPVKAEKTVLLDFGARELRGGIYEIQPGAGADGETKITSVSSLFDKAFGTDGIDHHVVSMLTDFYCAETQTPYSRIEPRVLEQMQAFAYQHKDLLFQQNIGARPVKLYYNFIYPPIVNTVTGKMLDGFIKPYKDSFTGFLERLFSKSIAAGKVDVDTVICTGGGFEMLWARNAVTEFFTGSEILLYKNPKSIAAEGASIRSAEALNIIVSKPFYIEDSHKLNVDIGVGVRSKSQNARRSKFFPVVERNSFWWQPHDPVSFIYSGATEQDSTIKLYIRNEFGEMKPLGDIPLNGLPERPPGTTRLALWLEFTSYNMLTATVRDLGFGEMFPFSDYTQKVKFTLDADT